MRPKLAYHTRLFQDIKQNANVMNQPHEIQWAENVMTLLRLSTVHDCRDLPYDFVWETGYVAREEAPQEEVPWPLPELGVIGNYYEFTEKEGYVGILALMFTFLMDDEPDDKDPLPTFITFRQDEDDSLDLMYFYPTQWDNRAGTLETKDLLRAKGFEDPTTGWLGAAIWLSRSSRDLVMGVVALMRDQLLLQRLDRDPMPYLSAKRARKGKNPRSSDVNVITINVPAVRRAAASSPMSIGDGNHDSPALHWRRGHWRTLHRGSEFESRIWIRRCLVGDPDKGFVSSEYRLTHRAPVIVQ